MHAASATYCTSLLNSAKQQEIGKERREKEMISLTDTFVPLPQPIIHSSFSMTIDYLPPRNLLPLIF